MIVSSPLGRCTKEEDQQVQSGNEEEHDDDSEGGVGVVNGRTYTYCFK